MATACASLFPLGVSSSYFVVFLFITLLSLLYCFIAGLLLNFSYLWVLPFFLIFSPSHQASSCVVLHYWLGLKHNIRIWKNEGSCYMSICYFTFNSWSSFYIVIKILLCVFCVSTFLLQFLTQAFEHTSNSFSVIFYLLSVPMPFPEQLLIKVLDWAPHEVKSLISS